jgi:hypothetical protein
VSHLPNDFSQFKKQRQVLPGYSDCQKSFLQNCFSVILREGKDLSLLKMRDSSLRSEWQLWSIRSFARASKVFSDP